MFSQGKEQNRTVEKNMQESLLEASEALLLYRNVLEFTCEYRQKVWILRQSPPDSMRANPTMRQEAWLVHGCGFRTTNCVVC